MNATLWPENILNGLYDYDSLPFSLIAIVSVQLALTLIDEFFYHHRRGLPKWERIGHPLDVVTVLICIGYALLVPWTAAAQPVYVGIAVFSCLFVTKDEWVHSAECSAGENFLHALLFIMHPVLLFQVFELWRTQAEAVLRILFIMSFLFGSYQTIYWNLLWRKKQPSTTLSTTA